MIQNYGLVAFVLFPIPLNDDRWKSYIERISNKTEIDIDYNKNCQIIEMDIDDKNRCNVLVCCFTSRKFDNYSL